MSKATTLSVLLGQGFLIALLSLVRVAHSAESLDGGVWSFEELKQIGLEGNLDLQSSRLAVEGLRWDRMEAWGTLLPSASLAASYGRSRSKIFNYEFPDGSIHDASLESKSTSSGTSISLRQPIFEGFSRIASVRQALLEEQNVIGANTLQNQQFIHDLRKASHAVLAASDRLEMERELLAQVGQQLELAKVKLTVGTGTELDLLQSELEQGRQYLRIESAELELQNSWDKLALLLGVNPGKAGRLDMALTVFEPVWNEDALVSKALEHRLDLQRSGRLVGQAKLDVVQNRSRFLPTVSLDLGHYRDSREDGYAAWDPDQKNYTNSAQLSLSLPLFQGFSSVNALKRSKADLRRRELETEQQRRQVRSEVREALLQLHSAWRQSRLTQSNMKLARQSMRLERERFRQGLSSLLHLKDAEATWRQAMNEDLGQRLAFKDRLAELELAVGGELEVPRD